MVEVTWITDKASEGSLLVLFFLNTVVNNCSALHLEFYPLFCYTPLFHLYAYGKLCIFAYSYHRSLGFSLIPHCRHQINTLHLDCQFILQSHLDLSYHSRYLLETSFWNIPRRPSKYARSLSSMVLMLISPAHCLYGIPPRTSPSSRKETLLFPDLSSGKPRQGP
jgi:hypothetical protein